MEDSAIVAALATAGISAPLLIKETVGLIKQLFPSLRGRGSIVVAYLVGALFSAAGVLFAGLDLAEPATYGALVATGFALGHMARAYFEAGKRAEAEHQLQSLRNDLNTFRDNLQV